MLKEIMPAKWQAFKKLPFSIPYLAHYSKSKFVTRKDSEIPDLTLLSSKDDNPYLV